MALWRRTRIVEADVQIGIGVCIDLITETIGQCRADRFEEGIKNVLLALERISNQKLEVGSARWNIVAEEHKRYLEAYGEAGYRPGDIHGIELAVRGACNFDFNRCVRCQVGFIGRARRVAWL